jgi:membrane fusion protein
VPEGAQLQAHLFAPSGAVGFVRPEQGVRLRVQAYAHQKFGVLAGRVVQVSRTPLGAEELVGLVPSGGGEPMFRITVALDTKEWSQPLAAGMRLDADVLLERRRLVEWLFAPVIGLKQRVAGSAATVAPAG